MPSSSIAHLGIYLGSGRAPFAFAALDGNCDLLDIGRGGLNDALTFAGRFTSAVAALDAPPILPRPAGRKQSAEGLSLAERDLRARGIASARLHADPASSRATYGRLLTDGLHKSGFAAYPDDGAPRVWMESNAHACFVVMLEGRLLPRPTLEGRLQRQILLYDAGVGVNEPMDFFDELTRHNLKMGQLPLERVHTPEQLDALVLAYTAWMYARHPGETVSLGTVEEGRLLLPVRELKEKY